MQHFCSLADGRAIESHVIATPKIRAEILTYGACWRGLWSRDDPWNWVLGHTDMAQIEQDPSYWGVIVGRVAGRLPQMSDFAPIGTAQLTGQSPGVILHGGASGSARRVWQVREASTTHIVLMDRLDHGHMGFPGAVEVTVTYRVSDDRLDLQIEALSLQDTVVNFAPHPYFCLGDQLADHVFTMNATQVQLTDALQLARGPLVPLPKDWDFRTARPLGGVEIDHKFVAQGGFNASLSHPNGRSLSIASDAPAAQVFTGRGRDAGTGATWQGLAIEPQLGAPGPEGQSQNFKILREGERHVSAITITLDPPGASV